MSNLATQLGNIKYNLSRPILFKPSCTGVWKGAGLTIANTDFEFHSEAAFSSLTIMKASRSLTNVLLPRRMPLGGQFTANVPTQEYRGHIIAPMNCVTLFITKDLLEETLDVDYTPATAIKNLSRIRFSNYLGPLMQAVIEDACNGNPCGPLLGESIIAAIIYHTHPAEIGKLEIRERRHASIPLRTFNSVTDLIHAKLAEPLHLSELAKFAGLSIRQFSRSFSCTTGVSPHQYIIRARVEHAQQLIATTEESLENIAWTVGFADRSHMTTSFVKLLGVAPSYFRNTHAK